MSTDSHQPPDPAPASPNPPLPQPLLSTLWYEPPGQHFDLRFPWWLKCFVVILLTLAALLWWDYPLAHWALTTHPIPDLARGTGGDVGRDLMFLEQWGQWACSIIVIIAVALLDRAGRRRAFAIALGCLATVFVAYFLKEVIGRSRPYVIGDGSWAWGGGVMAIGHGSSWQSFPSSHTTGAFALAAGLAWFYPRGRALFMTLATITAIQRVLHGAHFLSDVIAGMGIAVFITRWTLGGRIPGRLINLMPPNLQQWFLTDSLPVPRPGWAQPWGRRPAPERARAHAPTT